MFKELLRYFYIKETTQKCRIIGFKVSVVSPHYFIKVLGSSSGSEK